MRHFAAALLACGVSLALFGDLSAKDPNNPSPTIVNMSAAQVPGKKFRVWGTVSDNAPGSCGVTFTGAIVNAVSCDANGNFDHVHNVPTLGAFTAIAGDGNGQSAPFVLGLTNVAPTITPFTAIRQGTSVTFSGQVNDEASVGLVVTLAGPRLINGQTTTVNGDGTWEIRLTLPASSQGNVTASTVDWYGLTGSASTSY